MDAFSIRPRTPNKPRRIAVVEATVVEVDPVYHSGTLRINEPFRTQVGFGYLLFDNREVMTEPNPLTVGRQVLAEVWTPQKLPGKHEARNVWCYAIEEE
jgi:hypothetical protein